MKVKTWWIINVVWVILFAALTIWIMVRKIDGAGVQQSFPIKMMSLSIIGGLFVLVAICQLFVWKHIRR